MRKSGGLHYESVMEMPAGMREQVVAQVLAKVSAQPGTEVPADREEPCETCLRWWECNGVDVDNCPLCGG